MQIGRVEAGGGREGEAQDQSAAAWMCACPRSSDAGCCVAVARGSFCLLWALAAPHALAAHVVSKPVPPGFRPARP